MFKYIVNILISINTSINNNNKKKMFDEKESPNIKCIQYRPNQAYTCSLKASA